jgi:hypothetical protein
MPCTVEEVSPEAVSDTGSFGSLQALPSFLNQFGEPTPKTGVMELPTGRKSLMNSGGLCLMSRSLLKLAKH